MDVSATLLTAANIMVTGMVGVFLFLSILIFIVKLVARWCVEEAPVMTKKPTIKQTLSEQVPATHVAAISAAIAQYKKQHQQE